MIKDEEHSYTANIIANQRPQKNSVGRKSYNQHARILKKHFCDNINQVAFSFSVKTLSSVRIVSHT